MGDMQPANRSGLLPFGVALAIGMVLSASVVSRTFERVKSANHAITVKGYAEKRITSDRSVWSGSFSARAPELIGAYSTLQKDLATVMAYLDSKGFAGDAVTVSSISTHVLHKRLEDGTETNDIEGYELTQSVSIVSDNVGLVDVIATNSTTLIKDAVQLRSREPSFFYTALDDLKIEMLAAATKDARRRADEIARNGGCRLGALQRADQGVFQITPPHSTEVSGYGISDTSSIEKSIKAIITVEYSIK